MDSHCKSSNVSSGPPEGQCTQSLHIKGITIIIIIIIIIVTIIINIIITTLFSITAPFLSLPLQVNEEH
ncbi:hypothetical protein JZ751_017375 [Albula glossodonta]|uniref:Uncharacterized protein n=1 Tax=Albula glossodonta TaxID=121402 RepID=A0A8T2PKF0_9TELE|nr:hypothetical protein JZ751_017375 [Albula glossodonta]